MPIKYDALTISNIKNELDYKTNLDNPYIIERSNELINDNFLEVL